jgi:hypothetical protein
MSFDLDEMEQPMTPHVFELCKAIHFDFLKDARHCGLCNRPESDDVHKVDNAAPKKVAA